MSGWIEILNLLLTGTEIGLWIGMVAGFTEGFTTDVQFNVYEDMNAPVRFLKLANGGANLRTYLSKLDEIARLVAVHNAYALIHSFNIMLFLARFIEAGHFQPRCARLHPCLRGRLCSVRRVNLFRGETSAR